MTVLIFETHLYLSLNNRLQEFSVHFHSSIDRTRFALIASDVVDLEFNK